MKNNEVLAPATPSIGNIGTKIDYLNNRIKVLCADEFNSITEIHKYLKSIVENNYEACELLKSSNIRFTARVFGRGISTIDEFEICNGLIVSEEARIKTSIGLDIIYIGGNQINRIETTQLGKEKKLSLDSSRCIANVTEPHQVSFEQLTYPLSESDVEQLLEMYNLCFTDYLVQFDEELVQNAARGAIFIVARDEKKRIIASAIGESLRVGPLTLLEISEVAANPILRIKGAASGCVRRVINTGYISLMSPVVTFWEARMWRNILGIGPLVGLPNLGGVLHQHCKIASTEQFTSVPQTPYGSLAVFYGS